MYMLNAVIYMAIWLPGEKLLKILKMAFVIHATACGTETMPDIIAADI